MKKHKKCISCRHLDVFEADECGNCKRNPNNKNNRKRHLEDNWEKR